MEVASSLHQYSNRYLFPNYPDSWQLMDPSWILPIAANFPVTMTLTAQGLAPNPIQDLKHKTIGMLSLGIGNHQIRIQQAIYMDTMNMMMR